MTNGSRLFDRIHRLLRPQEYDEGRSFMEKESSAQIEGGLAFLERDSGEREQVLAAVASLEGRNAQLEGIFEQALAELDHYADEPTDPDVVDKVKDLVEVMRKAMTPAVD